MRKILLILSGIILITIGFFYYINLQAKETVVETPSSETSKKTLQRDYKHLNNKLLPTIDTSAWKTYDNVFGEHRYKFKYPNNITISDFDDQSGNIDLFANNELMLSLSIYPWEFYQPRYNGEELLDYINGTSDNFDGINMDEYDTIKFDTNKYFICILYNTRCNL